MSCGPQGGRNQTIFSSGTPHFFCIIVEETLQENRLRIPQKFVRKCGETLSRSVFVKVPCGSKWKMQLGKQDDKIWLEKGWADFAKHYSIKRGSMVMFRYEGNSEFHAVIFDTSTVEIDYPCVPVHFDTSVIALELRTPKEVVVEDDFVEISDDSLPCPKARDKSPSHKRMRTSPTALEFGAIPEHRLTFAERARILERVPFESDKPFFKALMQPSYVGSKTDHLYVPLDFAMRYIKSQGDVMLSVPNGRTWFVEFRMTPRKFIKLEARLCHGWHEFANDNTLEVGDVCIFKLLDGTKTSFEVSIVRFDEYECRQWSQAHEGGAIHVEPVQSLTNDAKSGGLVNGETSVPISHKNLPRKRANGCILSNPWKTRRKKSLNFVEKARILERAPFECETPFFKIVISPSYSYRSSLYLLNIPLDIAKKCIKKEGDVVLSVPDGRSWSAHFRFRRLRNGKHAAEIYDGWKGFAVDNNVDVGDLCIFKLINGPKISFEVYIIRVADDAYGQMIHGGECAKGASKKNGHVTVKTEID